MAHRSPINSHRKRSRTAPSVPPPTSASASGWHALTPAQQLLNSCALALFAGVSLMYGMGGILYGQMPLFVLFGFVDLRGWIALPAALSAWLLAAVCVASLVHRHAPSAIEPLRLMRWRRGCVRASVVLAGVAALLLLLVEVGVVPWLGRWGGLAPRSEWLLTPLPWAWPWAMGAARDDLHGWLLGFALVALVLGGWFLDKGKLPRTGILLLGLVALAAGVWALGGAVHHYVAGHGLTPVVDAAALRSLQSTPGPHNANIFLWLLSAWTLFASAVLLIYGALAATQPPPPRH